RSPPSSSLFPYTPLFRSRAIKLCNHDARCSKSLFHGGGNLLHRRGHGGCIFRIEIENVLGGKLRNDERVPFCLRHNIHEGERHVDRKSTRLNSSHVKISY